MTVSELRASFLKFFADRDHQIVASSPLVPGNDPTLLFTNAGMVQFKDTFLGHEKRAYQRAVSAQRCVRAGGKHNDLDNVGYTSRHHTFFEMLGNFSFGDYFKSEAIRYAWEYLTGELALTPEKLWVTVFEEDDEAANIWLGEIGVDPARLSRLGAKDNFWSMGDTGPCGPCSEIFYDHGPGVAGGPPGSPDQDGDRFVEIWNLVFMQFDRAADGSMTALPKPSVDTGMGLERMSAVMQGATSNYEIDLFSQLIADAASIMGVNADQSSHLRVVADHIRACAFLIADGVLPGNEGRGYVLRRIIRRALRHGYDLGLREPFFYKLTSSLEKQMGAAYPELGKARGHVEKVLLREEQRFVETLDQGMHRLQTWRQEHAQASEIPGELSFFLYDTCGFPPDMTADIARGWGLEIDQAGFDRLMAEQRQLSRKGSQFKGRDAAALQSVAGFAGLLGDSVQASEFVGYDRLAASARIVGLVKEGAATQSLSAGEVGAVALDTTPFYAESGGQVGDSGQLKSDGASFAVEDTQKDGDIILHLGRLVEGTIETGAAVEAVVNAATRASTVRNHSATHLLHAALRQVLGEHVQQKGSLVAPDRLRFDFSHYEAVKREELDEIERLVNEQIRDNVSAETRVMPYQSAVDEGAIAFFGEKYGDDVRVLRMGDFSMELCGGTHVSRAGDIGLIKITAEGGIASGVRRIEAVTGEGALSWISVGEQALRRVADMLRGTRDDVDDKVRQVLERGKTLEREVRELRKQLHSGRGNDLSQSAVEVAGVKVLAARLEHADPKTLRDTVDQMKHKLGSAVVVLASVDEGKVRLAAGVTKDLTDSIKAGELVGVAAKIVGGRGGGRPDMAQAGGTQPEHLDQALESIPQRVQQLLSYRKP